MRIVHVTNWYIRDMGYQENHLPLEQKRLGHEVAIITGDRLPPYGGFQDLPESATKGLYPGRYDDMGVEVLRLPCIDMKGPLVMRGLRQALRELRPDVVHAHGFFQPSTMRAVVLSRRLGYKVFVDDHCHESVIRPNSLLWHTYLTPYRAFYHLYGGRVRCFMPVTQSALDIMQRVIDAPGDRVEIVPLGACTRRFKKSAKLREEGRRELGIKDDEILIISTGKFCPKKDIDILIRAFKKAQSRTIKATLLLMGSSTPGYRAHLGELVGSLGLAANVQFKDFVPNTVLPKYYNASDIGVWPGAPSITILEACACGLPVVIPEHDPAYGPLRDAGAALGFRAKDPVSLSSRLIELIDRPEERRAMSEQGVRTVQEAFSWEHIAERTINIYQRALESSN